MTSKEIFERIIEVMERKGISREELALNTGINIETLSECLKRKSGMIYSTLDILDGVGLELQLDNKPIDTHQDIIDYIADRDIVNNRIENATGIFHGTVKSFIEGNNVSFDKAVRILDALGIEVRVV